MIEALPRIIEIPLDTQCSVGAPSAPRLSARRPSSPRAGLVQNPLGIAVRLSPSLEDQVAGRVESSAIKPRRHGSIDGIARILPVDNLGHPPQRPQHLLLVDYAVM